MFCTELLSGSRKRGAPAEPIKELPEKRRRRTLLLGEEMAEQVKLFLKCIRKTEGVVNSQIIVATAKGEFLPRTLTCLQKMVVLC